MAFESFQKFIPKAANHFGIATEMKAAEVCHHGRALIPQIFPQPEAIENINAAHYKDSILTYKTTSPAWSQEIVTRKHKIIDELNTRLGKKVVSDLRTQISS